MDDSSNVYTTLHSDQSDKEKQNKRQNTPYDDLPTSFCSRDSCPEKRTRRDCEELSTVNDYFNKKYHFQSASWCIVDPDEMFSEEPWEIPDLQKKKHELNRVKNKLNNYDLEDWHKHTRAQNKAGDIQWKLKNEFDPEFVTQAWCKFFELVSSYKLLPEDALQAKNFNSVHLCEAPGAFVTSLNHFLKIHHPDVKWQWKATTLNPYYEGNPLSYMINDDRFILQTLPNWTFGEDFTGDLMNLDNMYHLVRETEKMGNVHLVTADGSIDCQEDPGEQESVVSRLHYCETVAALHILKQGGSFVLKMFTMYEADSVCLMYLLCCSFEEVNVFKPATSKEGNSEVYVICLNYKGKMYMQPWLKKLTDNFGVNNSAEVMFPLLSVPQNFIDQLITCADKFKDLQINVIENNIEMFKRGKKRTDYHTKRLRYLIAQHYMEHYRMKKLCDESEEVVGKQKLKETVTLNLDPRKESGSYNERCRIKSLQPSEKFEFLREDLCKMEIKWPFQERIKWLELNSQEPQFKVQTGKPVDIVHSSKFCLGQLLNIRTQVQNVATKMSEMLGSVEQNTLVCTRVSHDDPLMEVLQDEDPKIVSNIKSLYFKDLWNSTQKGHNGQSERDAFIEILDTLEEMWRDENLLLKGYPMLTQFNVGVIYLLSHLFKKVGFIEPNKQDFAIIFVGLNCLNRRRLLSLLDPVVDAFFDLEKEHRTVLAVLPIDVLCGKNSAEISNDSKELNGDSTGSQEIENTEVPIFYKCVTEINHICVKEQILDIIGKVSLQSNCD